ncbi:MAG TPA: hypothetical protein VHW23_17025 [Kofleriaceae bacterium]|jgi:hypothetical protein|nr:hypothetical protein [Kofleriaceae bacterium]
MYFSGHALIENRHGLLVDFRIARATGTAEREVALAMLENDVTVQRATVAADKRYDRRPFVEPCRAGHLTVRRPQGPVHGDRCHEPPVIRGYTVSQRIRKRVEDSKGST